MISQKILSCFIDESGDFGPYDYHSPYYYVTIVLHNQEDDIADKIQGLEYRTSNLGYTDHAIHTGPLIRRESIYSNDLVEDRKHLFNVLYYFAIHLPIKYFTVRVNKSECADEIILTAKLSKLISQELHSRDEFWNSFSKIIVYYDNGQTQLTRIITSVFNTLFTDVEMRKVQPVDYKLFQVADLICTVELLADKAEHNSFTKSELDFFDTVRDFKKNYLKHIRKMKL
ncbi:MAG: DUF3800 domain-containing protein [Lachnospiraceae bacterium]|nr:DUF3800 domain-containing protein [Lachnospiraceae bacterium]